MDLPRNSYYDEKRDELKKKAKILASADSLQQAEIWSQYKMLRNKVNSKIRKNEISYKKEQMNACQGDPSKVWRLAKSYMEWKSAGPP